jgi:hypothetical protein
MRTELITMDAQGMTVKGVGACRIWLILFELT